MPIKPLKAPTPVPQSPKASPKAGAKARCSGQLQNHRALVRTTNKGLVIFGNSHIGILHSIPDQIKETRLRDS